ncbi:MAG: hypothetical protein LBS50_11560 [Prevotellaceae bacterium]|nr:hypothetical protein [Prevotellaceae bacterium]
MPVLLFLLSLFLIKIVSVEVWQRTYSGTWIGEISTPAKLSELKFYTDSTMNNKVTIIL